MMYPCSSLFVTHVPFWCGTLMWLLTAYEGTVSIQEMSVPSTSCCYGPQAALALFVCMTLLHLRK